MKKKGNVESIAALSERRAANAGEHWLNYFFPLLPFVVLIPDFILPSLGYPGLATQELGFATAIALCIGLS